MTQFVAERSAWALKRGSARGYAKDRSRPGQSPSARLEPGSRMTLLDARELAVLGHDDSNQARPRAPGGGGGAPSPEPGVQADVVVVAARRQEQRARIPAHGDVEPEPAGVERLRGG